MNVKSGRNATKLIISVTLLLGATTGFSNDYACFVDPWDDKPENRINVVPSLGYFMVMDVKEDGKTFVSKPPPVEKIIDFKRNSNGILYLVPKGGFIVSEESDSQAYRTGLYAKQKYNDPGKFTNGVLYKCEARRVVTD